MQLFIHTAPETDSYDTRRIEADRLYDGSTDITIFVGEPGASVSWTRHNLPISESDKLGAALCKDIIDNYARHNANLEDKIADLEDVDREMRYHNTELQNKNMSLARIAFAHDNEQAAIIRDLENRIVNLQETNNGLETDIVLISNERNSLLKEVASHKDFFTKYAGRIEDLEYKNAELGRITLAHDEEHATTLTRMQCRLADCQKEFAALMEERNEYKETLRLERIDGEANRRVTNRMWHDTLAKKDSDVRILESEIAVLQEHIRERNHTINAAIVEHNNHTQQLYDRIEELEAENTSMEQCTNLHNLCFAADLVHCENIGVPVYGMRCQNFERMIKGYRGTLSRHGKTIVIVLPFEHEIVAKNAVEYITGQEV